MSEEIKGFSVVLEKDVSEDDFDKIRNAVLMIKGVLKIVPVSANIEDAMIRFRVRMELTDKIRDILWGRDE